MGAATLRRLLAAAFALLAGIQASGLHAQAPFPETLPVVFERAEFAPVKNLRPPGDEAPWRPVALPDNWYLTRPDFNSGGWYRITLPLTTVPRRVHALYFPRGSAPFIRAHVNGHVVGSTFVLPELRMRLNQQALTFSVPPAVLREGTNVLHVYVEGRADLRQGLTRVWFGDGPLIRAMWLERFQRQVILALAFAFSAVAAGLIALAVWFRSRQDAAFLWFGLAGVLLGAPAITNFFFDFNQSGLWRGTLYLIYANAYAPALALGAISLAGNTRRWMVFTLWGLLVAGCALPLLLGNASYPWMTWVLGLVFLTILVFAFSILFARKIEVAEWMRGAVAAALAAAIALTAHDLAHWMSWVDFDRPFLLPFVAPVLTFTLGMLLITRHLNAMRGLSLAKEMLEQRVMERTAEIERAHERMRALEAERTRVSERQRIMSDIHDGLGASLVSLLSVVRRRGVESVEIERRVHDALQELRLAVDSQDTMDGDLLTALATIRFRMRDALEAAGIALEWDIADIPSLDNLSSRSLLGVQRIVLEALTNAIRHAKATRVSVSVVSAADHVAVLITDNGRGFDSAAQVRVGRGIAGMRRRAADAGFTLRIESAPERGTRITLTLPLQTSRVATERLQ